MKNYKFFLGGRDLEMVRIAEILAEAGEHFADKGLGWGAKASAYTEEIAAATADGLGVVLVELEIDITVPERTVIVDHHGDRAGEPASILQVASLVGVTTKEWMKLKLIAANDSGYIPAMQAAGATPEEIAEVRLADRAAQGITLEQEAEAERALGQVEVIGRLTVVRMAHSKCATVTDRLFGQYDQLLILSADGEVNFFGQGDICADMKERFEGWNGGSGLGKADGIGYWGGYPNHDEALNFVRAKVNPSAYSYAILDPRPIPAAQEANEKVFATGPVVGIEVTVPALAARCIANIDPQHSGNNHELAAIEVAMTAELPADGSVLTTVRADLDSVGAMAVFALRRSFGKFFEEIVLGDIIGRVQIVAESDRFARGGWSGVRPLPSAEALFDDTVASAESDSRLAPMAAAIADFKVPLAARVEVMIAWLLTGKEPAGYRDRWLAERKALAVAIADGTINATTVADGKIARVVSTHRAATSVGYCLAPVVVALNPSFSFQSSPAHAKFTICQFTAEYVDLKAALAELAGLEAGWGGSPTIGGSPQGVSSTLTIEQVVGALAKHLK